MGTSTNAILAFGFDLGDELPDSMLNYPDCMEEGFDAEDFFAHENGWQDLEYKERSEKIKQLPLDIIVHCSYEYPMYFLAVRGTKQTAFRGSPRKVNTSCYANGEQMKAMREFCAKHNIPWQEPQWYIFSMWS